MDPGVHINGNVRLALLLLAAAALPAGEYSTYIGDENTWHIARVIVDASGNTYVAGSRTFNLSFDPLQPDALTEAIVAKLDTTGKTVLFAGIGGKGSEAANDVAVDRAGNIYIAGRYNIAKLPGAQRALSGGTVPAGASRIGRSASSPSTIRPRPTSSTRRIFRIRSIAWRWIRRARCTSPERRCARAFRSPRDCRRARHRRDRR